MTMRLVLGIDPGQTGCIAILADGMAGGFIDMPLIARKAGGHQIDPYTLAARVRQAFSRHEGAYMLAVCEQVSAMPKQGGSSMFRFGQSDGIARGVIGALGIPMIEVHPSVWKKQQGLIGSEKDVARSVAIQRFPDVADHMQRKKDIGRADALLIALWAWQTEQVGAISSNAD